MDGAATVLIDEIEELLEKQGYQLNQIADAVLGLAGADYEEETFALRRTLQDRGLKNCFVCNDGYLGVMAGIESGVGICYSRRLRRNLLRHQRGWKSRSVWRHRRAQRGFRRRV